MDCQKISSTTRIREKIEKEQLRKQCKDNRQKKETTKKKKNNEREKIYVCVLSVSAQCINREIRIIGHYAIFYKFQRVNSVNVKSMIS